MRSGAEASRPALEAKLRRVGGMYVFLTLLLLAAVHWIAGDIGEAVAARGVSPRAVRARVAEEVARLELVLAVAGLTLLPVSLATGVLAGRFVRRHFSEIEAATRHKSQFVRFVAHEMHTPLNAIAGFADLLAESRAPLTDEQRDYVHEIRQGIARIRRLISDVLDLARVEAGRFEVNRTDVPVGPAIAEAAETVTAAPTAS